MELTQRPTYASINLENLRHNTKQILSKMPKGQEPLAIIKANAYGHGAVFISRTLVGCGINKLGVATFSEGLELRKEGIQTEIYVLNGILAPLSDYFSNRLYPVIYDIEQLKLLCDYIGQEPREFKACLKFDTGMGRLGFAPAQVDEIVGLLRKTEQLKIAAVMTHLAKADEEDEEFTKRQFTLFRKLRDIIKDRGIDGMVYSICNSAAIIDNRLDDFNWARPGIALYGSYPNTRHQKMIDLKPVLEFKTKIINLKRLMQNATIGYGGTFTTSRESLIAILPVGYADGYPRLASNRGHVLVNGKKAPIVGRISMDLMAIDVTDVPNVKLHDDVVLIGKSDKELIRAEDVAEWADTISYEILCGISPRVPRVYEGM